MLDELSAELESDVAEDRIRRVGYAIFFCFVLGFGAWSAFAPLESAAFGVGTVEVKGSKKVVQHLKGGRVSEILVSNGDYVAEEQPLLRLDETRVLAELRVVDGRMWAKRATVDRLISERDRLPAVKFRDEFAGVEDPRALNAMASEQALFEARMADLSGERELISLRVDQLETAIVGLEAVIDAKTVVAESMRLEILDLKGLLEQGYVDRQRVTDLERTLSQISGEIADLQAKLSKSKIAKGEASLQGLQLAKRFTKEVTDKLSVEFERLYDLELEHKVASDIAERTTIRAPASGYIMALKPTTIGEVIAPGQDILSLVPDIESLVIEAQLSPMDIDRIELGQEVEVRFSVFKDAYSITGDLVKLSADRLSNEATGEAFYAAQVALRPEDLVLLGSNRLVPGMPAEVLVKTGNRTLLGYLVSPLNRMFENSLIED